jgi:hypothetical protein
LICHTDAALLLINIERLEKFRLEGMFNPNFSQEGRQEFIGKVDLDIKRIIHNYDNLIME